MKILKYILYAVLILAVIFLAVGFIVPSVEYQNSITVNEPANVAWNSMMDESTLSEWLKGYKRTELVSGEAGTVGAVSNIYFEQNGEETVIKETITKIVPGKTMAMNFSMGFMDMDYEMETSEKDGITTINTSSAVTGNGVFARSMVAMAKGTMSDQEDENLSNLKALVERSN